jgi:hypothetical protein
MPVAAAPAQAETAFAPQAGAQAATPTQTAAQVMAQPEELARTETPGEAATAPLEATPEPARATVSTVEAAARTEPEPQRVPEEYSDLAPFIDALYEQATEEAIDSPTVSAQCLALLHAARAAFEQRDYALAEFKAEEAKARLLRARASNEASASFSVKLIWLWNILAGALAVGITLLPFYVRLTPAVVPLLRAISLATLGGVMVALWNLTHYISNREYDTAYNSDYFASPIKGALVGGLMFVFLSALGFVSPPRVPGAPTFGTLNGANLPLYFLALLAGIAQDYIFVFVRGVLAAIFRVPARTASTSAANEP